MSRFSACVAHSFRTSVCLGTILALIGGAGCSSVAPSKTASGAGTGAVLGGVTGAVVGSNTGMGGTTGALGGVAAGALVGGIIGLAQEMKDRKEQDRLAQERAYQQDLAKRRSQDAKLKAEMEEELAVAQGFRISDLELSDAQKKTDDTAERLKRLRDERAAALNRKKTLDDLREKQLTNEAEIARLEEEISRLKGETPLKSIANTVSAQGAGSPVGKTPAEAPAKPGI